VKTTGIENLHQIIQVDPGGGRSTQRSRSYQGEDASRGEATQGFVETLKDSIREVNRHQLDANQSIRELVAGRTKNVHETMLAVERADLSLKLMVQVRNKIMDAYREIMRMQV